MPAKVAITPELYDALLHAYRECPGNASNAAREAGCERGVAKRAWERGWVPRIEYAKPIREVIRAEINAAKAKRHEQKIKEEAEQEALREKSRKDSVDTLKEEALVARAARQNAMGAAGIVGHLLNALGPLTKRLTESLKDDTMKPAQVVKIIRDTLFAVRQGNEAVRVAFELERLRLGEPTQILGLASGDDLTPDEAVQELLSLQRTLLRAQQTPMRYGQKKLLPDGTVVIDLPQDAYEEDPSKVIPFPRKTDEEESA